ncbi:L-threonylcarbamoyladenylate synthase [Deinobacterium chartae]|uniref:L-threonylcarbamoyladenylate synthase n=1 Tax=Deinobacterium chartae TaxID=521158 RepID=A0A841HXT2_9DEIO|nr:L-threonylcarbamoyladenylate synthase [Deinobacterium chartae]MBB6097010.1 L-threonylcarbamoyladenylate synthase [Deinobacterium chartae]
MKIDLERALEVLSGGGVVAVPTETVWGLVCDPFNERAVRRLFDFKHRPANRPLQFLCHDADRAARLCDLEDPVRARDFGRLSRFWPGPLTVLMPAAPDVPAWMAPGGKVGVRVPLGEPVQGLLARVGGVLAASSLNRSGEPAAFSLEQALAHPELYDGLLEGQPGFGQASTVFDYPTRQVLRQGGVSLADLEGALSGER